VARWYFDRKVPVAIPLAISIMFFGFLWRKAIVERLPEARSLAKRQLVIIFASILPIAVFAYSKDHGFHETWWRYTSSYSIGLTIFILFTTRIKIASKPFLFLGKISYSVYLFAPAGQLLAMQCFPTIPTTLPIHLAVALVMLLTVGIATVTYYAVEAPAMALGRKVREALIPRTSAS
jgi:peptidoglycan/LPS O-acetylase OafA/YrhL